MEKINLVNSYKNARSTLLAVIIFSVINCLLLLGRVGYTFLYSAITPKLAIIFAQHVFRGFTSLIVIVMFAFVPLALYLISYILSNKDWKWLRVATILFAVDIVVFVIFFLKFGFDSSMIIDIIFEAVIMFSLVSGTIAGKKLNNDFEVEEIIIDSAANEEETGEDGEVKKVKIYSYDKQYANKNKANKNGLVYLSVLGLMAAMVVLIVFLTTLFKNNVLMILIVVYGLLAVYIVMIVKLSPYLSAKSFQYFKKDGVIYRNSTANGIVQALNDLRVESTTEDSFICSYQKKENQRKKLIIPNSYPGLEEILKY